MHGCDSTIGAVEAAKALGMDLNSLCAITYGLEGDWKERRDGDLSTRAAPISLHWLPSRRQWA